MKKTKSKLGIVLVESDNASTARTINIIKAQGALEMIDFLLRPWTPAEGSPFEMDKVFFKRIEAQRKILQKLTDPPKIKEEK